MRKLVTTTVIALASLPLVLSAQGMPTVETARFTALLSSSHETNPVNGPGGMANVTVEFILKKSATGDLQSAKVDFNVEYALGQAETLVAMHIHEGAEGVNGPVRVGSSFGDAVQAGPGSGVLFRSSAEVTDSATLKEVMEMLESPGGYYVNIHTLTNPGGIMRGQLMPDETKTLEMKVDAVKAETDSIKSMLRAIAGVLGLRLN